MSYKALYRKYRPTSFSEVVGQEHITVTLKNELAGGKIFHAYLFTGTRGTGKTSCAKILAKAVNCTSLNNGDPCCNCESCKSIAEGASTDIVEIDAASNNGVDNIRDLREQVVFAPANGKYRVYIIDEVHMLSQGAFNALLKTLEEPPEHVVFILATTEVHKLPPTILSRCQRFDFHRIDADCIVNRIKEIAKKENFKITDSAAGMIAAVADGGMRDALSVLDLCVAAATEITDDTVAGVCGMSGNESLLKFADYIKAQDAEKAIMLLDELYTNSVDMLRLLHDIIKHFRDLMIVKTVSGSKKPIICSQSHLKSLEKQAEKFTVGEIMANLSLLESAIPNMQSGSRRYEMEVLLIRLCTPSVGLDIASLEKRVTALESGTAPKSVAIQKPAEPEAEDKNSAQPESVALRTRKKVVEPEISGEPVKANPVSETGGNKMENELWQQVLHELSKTAPLISGILSDSSAYVSGDFLLIDTKNLQFAELINGKNNAYREKLKAAIETVTGNSYKLGPYKHNTAKAPADDPLLALKNKIKDLEGPKRS